MSLLDLLPMTAPDVEANATPAERAEAFHKANPKVYYELRRLAMQLVRVGHRKFGIAMIFEQLRWQWYERTQDIEGFKLNNSYRAFYARLLMESEPELAGVFETRRTTEKET